MWKCIPIVIALIWPLSANAVTEYNKTLTSVAVQGTGAYMTINPATTVNCMYTVLYIPDITSAQGKALLALALTAQSSQLTMQRIDYDVTPSGLCVISLIQIG